MARREGRKGKGPGWDAGRVRALRQFLGLSQEEMARELGTRQQTISEWERGCYRPRGTSERLLGLIAEQAGFPYETGNSKPETRGTDESTSSRP